MGKVSTAAALSRSLRTALGGITQAELAARLLVSRNYVSQIEAELKHPSSRLVAQMDAMLKESARADFVRSGGVEEQATEPYRKSGSPAPSSSSHPAPHSRDMTLSSRFQPPPEAPTREQCLEHLTLYLDAARHSPGGYGVALWKLKKYLPLEDFEPDKNSPP